MRRSRLTYFLLVVATILLGLASRRFRSELPGFLGSYAGDTLWASMVFFLAAMVWNRAATSALAVGSILFSFCIELSQLYHAPWIDSIRERRIGALVLGHGFLWSDLLCYAVGVGIAVVVDWILRPNSRKSRAASQ